MFIIFFCMYLSRNDSRVLFGEVRRKRKRGQEREEERKEEAKKRGQEEMADWFRSGGESLSKMIRYFLYFFLCFQRLLPLFFF